MSHVLVTTTPFGGHQPPMLGLTRELVRAGHRVTYYTGAKFRERAEEVGATWLPWVEALDFDDTDLAATFPTMRTDAGMAAMFSSFEQLFFGTGPGQLRDLIRFHDADPVDVVVNELTCVGGGFLHESRGVPWASFSLSPLPLTSRHLPPSGLPVRPARGPLGRTRDAALRALVQASWAAGSALSSTPLGSRPGLRRPRSTASTHCARASCSSVRAWRAWNTPDRTRPAPSTS